MLFPNTEIRFKLWDKLQLGVTAGGGTIGFLISILTKLAVIIGNPIGMATALIGLIGVIFRQVKQFFFKRTEYMMTLAQRLYFHALSDNHGVLTLMCDRAEEEDIKEDLLLYHRLGIETMPEDKMEQYDKDTEDYIEEYFGVKADFQIDEAVQRLEEDGLIFKQSGVYHPLSPEQVLASLKQRMIEKIESNISSGADPHSGI